MKDLATAIAMVAVIEGILYSLMPETLRRMMSRTVALPTPVLQISGLIAASLGVAAVWLIRQ
ncbi:MAG TPA: DUF2065 domain-containing protein [Stellaceae bacterium]|nr:DUF2065 domain-containing protein [Stellaceae bacterium]